MDFKKLLCANRLNNAQYMGHTKIMMADASVNDKTAAGFVLVFLRDKKIYQELTVPSFLNFYVNTKFKKGCLLESVEE